MHMPDPICKERHLRDLPLTDVREEERGVVVQILTNGPRSELLKDNSTSLMMLRKRTIHDSEAKIDEHASIYYNVIKSSFKREKLSSSNFNDWFHSPKIVLRVDKKRSVIKQHIPLAPPADSKYLHSGMRFMMLIMRLLVLGSEELKSMFDKQARVERFDLIQTCHACKPEEGKLVSSYVLKMKGYVKQLDRLGYVLPQDVSVSLILALLVTSLDLNPVRNRLMLKAKVKGKDKSYIPKPKNPKPFAKEHPTKDDACHHCKEVGHCKRNCPAYLPELIMKKKQVGTASSSAIFTI
ncbi:retrotransposon protein, putative, ty1-copia subclass [Tanacetum coccineum]|uniref:Retrotransposon protein, putative, ty1-copia subclass n=1 Tax=Tanacetum coccineum TaxID=301880 RepID=A0ABQ5HAE2_9ASTR